MIWQHILAKPVALAAAAFLIFPAAAYAADAEYPFPLDDGIKVCLAQNWNEPEVQKWLDQVADRPMRMKVYNAYGLPAYMQRCLMETKPAPIALCNELVANALQIPGHTWRPKDIPSKQFVDVTRRFDKDRTEKTEACMEGYEGKEWDGWTPADLAPDPDTADILTRARQGDKGAIRKAVELYRLGDKVPPDNKARGELIEKLAKAGDAEMARIIGLAYQSGQTNLPDYEKAREWLTSAANLGDAEAMYWLHILAKPPSADGPDAPPKENDQTWLSKAADAGYGPALTSMARLYAKTDEERLAYLRKAAEADDTGAMWLLVKRPGTLAKYLNPQDIQKWSRRADALGADGEGELLITYFPWGALPATPDALARVQEQHAVNDGDPDAMLAMARHYHDGVILPKDEGKAAHWWLAAAEKGDPIGMRMAGLSLLYGRGVDADTNRALPWLEKAAKLKDGEAAAILFRWYRAQIRPGTHLLDRIRLTTLARRWKDEAKAMGFSEAFLLKR